MARCITPFLLLLSLLAGLAEADGERKTLRRRIDHVVVEGKKLHALKGTPIALARAFRVRAGKTEPIPFQIDERTPAGLYAYDKGAETNRDVDKGNIDDNDELVFMARDSGDKAPAALLAKRPNCVEIEIKDPKNGRKGWIYLAGYKKSPPKLSPKDYVSISYSERGMMVYKTPGFYLDNARSEGNAVRTSTVKFKKKDGSLAKNVMDTTKVRLKIHYLLIPISRNGTEMRVVIGAFIDGPVRAVAMNKVEVYLVWGFWGRAPNSLIKFYDYGSEMPTNIKVPINVDKSPLSYYRVAIDLSSRARGWYFYNDRNPTPLKIDGRMGPREKKLDLRWPNWNVTYGPEGAFLTRLIAPKAVTKLKSSGLHYIDDLKADQSPDNEGGAFGQAGYQIDMSGIKAGIYSGLYCAYYLNRFHMGDERRYVDIVDHPLVTSSRQVTK